MSMQLPVAPELSKVPGLDDVKKTGPEGVIGVPRDVSVTLTVQEVGVFTGTWLGEQPTLVDVVRCVTTN